jgi:hypothetical protein
VAGSIEKAALSPTFSPFNKPRFTMIFDFNQSRIMNVIDSHKLERDAGGKPASAFFHPALRERGGLRLATRHCTASS